MSSKTAYFTAKTAIVGIIALTLVTIPLLGEGEEYGQSSIHTTSTCSETGADSDNSETAISRKKWSKSRLSGSPEPAAPYEVIRVYENLNFINPVIITGGQITGSMLQPKREKSTVSKSPAQPAMPRI